MTLKITFYAIYACLSLEVISGLSYSNVFVKSGADLVPVEYVKYGAPAVPIAGSQIAQISAAPVDSIVSLPSVQAVVSPCVAPCVIPGAPLSAVAPLSSVNAKIVTYKSPIANVPVVLANKDDAVSYQYAYSVYDESTGDKKAQSERSDGSVVQGQYSFIQPDGYRREVVYTADDLKGFNAVVRNFLPESDSKTVNKQEGKNEKDLPLCKDVKSEELTAPSTKEAEPTEAKPKEAEPKEAAPTEAAPTEAAPKEAAAKLEVENVEIPAETPKEAPTTPMQAASSSDPNNNAIFSYNDILACLQAKAQANNNISGISPLTYLLIPSFRGFGALC